MENQGKAKANNLEGLKKVKDFFMNKKVQNILLIVLLLGIIISGTWIRVQNLDLLTDSTTGEKIPLALDPYYFLRVAETKIANNGVLPEFDSMRYPSAKVDFTPEILPDAVIFLHKTASVFNPELTLRYIDVISPVIFFVFGIIIFFFLIYFLTKSKITAVLGSLFLAFIPSYLYRTMAGFADHEAIGMFAFFLALLGYTVSLKISDKKDSPKKDLWKSILLGLGVGFLSAFTIASWGGVANYIFMIIPSSFLLIWLFRNQKTKKFSSWRRENKILFYVSWIIGSVLFAVIFGYGFEQVINKYLLSGQGILGPFVLGFILIDYLMIYLYNEKENLLPKKIKDWKKYRAGLSFGIIFVLGVIALAFIGMNIIGVFDQILEKLIRPSGTGRLGTTVAENRAPFLNTWMSEIGSIFFWVFYIGMLFVGLNFSKGIKAIKEKTIFLSAWIIFISGILFSRISSDSVLNGTNFLSQLIYFGSLLIFIGAMIWIYFNGKLKLKRNHAIIISWLFFALISGRGAIRMFFFITPFICFMGGYAVASLFEYWKKSKEELMKILLLISVVAVILLLSISMNSFVQSSKFQAENTGPSANGQWQGAMEWVRNNTTEGSIFTHWWDYGYWVQYLGERPTVTDGGHGVGYWDHLIGRYLLTTPNPNSALSFMKTHDVSYLLIDQTDLGKYPAYSSIGSGPEKKDRASSIPVMNIIPEQTMETSNKTIRVYQGGTYVDEDIYYNNNGQEIFLPRDKAVAAGIILETSMKEQSIKIGNQTQSFTMMENMTARGVFYYNGNQYQIPLRYVYYNEKLIDTREGLNATAYILPKLSQPSAQQNPQQGLSLNQFGSVIYLSPKVSESLFAQLYLMKDPNDLYPTLNVSHKEFGPVMQNLKAQGASVSDFVNYRGFRGPITIWKTEYPEDILVREEFLETSAPEEEFGELDELKFREE